MLKKIVFICMLAVILLIPTLSETTPTLSDQAKTLFNEATSMDKTKTAIKQINDLVEQGFDKLRADVMIASLIANKASYDWNPLGQLGYANESIKKFEEIQNNTPELATNKLYLYEFSYNRGITFSYFPSLLKDQTIILNDLEKAEKLAVELNITDEHELAILYSRLIHMYKEKNQIQNAKIYAEKIITFKQNAKKMKDYKKQAKEILDRN